MRSKGKKRDGRERKKRPSLLTTYEVLDCKQRR